MLKTILTFLTLPFFNAGKPKITNKVIIKNKIIYLLGYSYLLLVCIQCVFKATQHAERKHNKTSTLFD